MDKTITIMGLVLVGLGVGFVIAGETMGDLHWSVEAGGFLWIILGAATVILGMKKTIQNYETQNRTPIALR